MVEQEIILSLRTILLLLITGTAMLLAPEGSMNALHRLRRGTERLTGLFSGNRVQRINGKQESFCEIDMTKFE